MTIIQTDGPLDGAAGEHVRDAVRGIQWDLALRWRQQLDTLGRLRHVYRILRAWPRRVVHAPCNWMIEVCGRTAHRPPASVAIVAILHALSTQWSRRMPLSAAQRQHLERRLLEERRRVLTDLGAYSELTNATEQERSGDLTVVPLHAADLGTDANREELAAANASRESAELEEIDAALARLYHSPERFGICEASGEEIPFERLDIIPWTRTCGGAHTG